MNSAVLLQRADGYLYSQFHDSSAPWPMPAKAAPFVTISREAGSGGATLARMLVRKLNAESPGDVIWRIYESNVTTQMLRSNHLPPRVARFLPEDRVPEIEATMGEILGLHPNLWGLVQKTNETMRELAQTGHVILVGRGANFATSDLPNGLHVRLIAPADHRARYLAQLYNISEAEAAAQNAKCDAARRRYVRTNFNADVTDPSAYDLCINTGRVALRTAVDVIRAHLSRSLA